MKYLMVGLLVLGMAFPSITQAQTVDPIQSQIDALVAQVAELQKLLALIQQVEALTARLEAVETKTNAPVVNDPVLGGTFDVNLTVKVTDELYTQSGSDNPGTIVRVSTNDEYDMARFQVFNSNGNYVEGANSLNSFVAVSPGTYTWKAVAFKGGRADGSYKWEWRDYDAMVEKSGQFTVE